MSGTTPRVTRSRTNTPLPALQTRQSHAYGAQGKAALTQQVTTSSAELNAAFSTTTRARGSTRPTSKSATPAPAKKQKSKATTPIVEEYDDEGDHDEPAEDDDDELSRPGTAIQHSAAYINVPDTSPNRPQMPAARPNRPRIPAAPPIRAQVPNTITGNDEDFEPHRASVLFHTIPRFLERIYGDGWQFIVMCVLTLLVLVVVLSPLAYLIGAGWGATRDFPWTVGLQHNYNAFRTSQLFSDDIQQLNTTQMQWAINAHLLGRVETLEINSTTTQQDIAIHQAMIEELQSILPNTIVMADDNGEYTIPPLFWKALAHKMESPHASSVWQHFLETNAQQLQTMSKEVFAGNFEDMVKSGRVISHDDFNVALSQHSQAVQDDLEQTMRKHKMSMLEEARNAAVGVLEQSEIMSLARMQIGALGYANFAHNMDHKLRQINYFGIGLGAMVDPFYTSETKMPPTQTVFQWLLHYMKLARQYPNPPSVALTAWTEPTEAWCGATSNDEKAMAQLTVKTAHKIYLNEITIEHFPASGTRDSASAPKDFQIWVQVANATEAARINKDMARDACVGKAPNGERNWVCLGTEVYDIHQQNFVQTFRFWPVEAATDRIALRVLSNWGAEGHTCLYRVLAAGEETQ